MYLLIEQKDINISKGKSRSQIWEGKDEDMVGWRTPFWITHGEEDQLRQYNPEQDSNCRIEMNYTEFVG